MSAISGFCEKCNKFRKRHCDGNRNTCMSILFDAIEALQRENEQLRAQVATHVGLLQRASIALYDLMYTLDFYMKESCIVPNDMHKRHIRQGEQTLAEIDRAIGGKEDA